LVVASSRVPLAFIASARLPPSALPLHDALPISARRHSHVRRAGGVDRYHHHGSARRAARGAGLERRRQDDAVQLRHRRFPADLRSEEHTSELQSHLNIVCRLLLAKKKTPIEYSD